MKEAIYPITSWVGYTKFIKDSIGRELTQADYKRMMHKYINGVTAEKCLEEMK